MSEAYLLMQINELMAHKNRQLDENKKIWQRTNELEQTIFSLGEMYKELSIKHVKLIDMELKKKPHKCPVCDGIGGTKVSGTIDEECHACEGKGIVWG